MSEQGLRPYPLRFAPLANVYALVHQARRGFETSARGRTWLFEIIVLLAVILALSVALQPRIQLLQIAPHPFWLPVVAAALVHGTLPGLTAAVLAGLCAWAFGGSLAGTEEDFYDQMFRAFKEPVLWLFAAILLGTFKDRIEADRQRLAEERDTAREDLAAVVEHATTLRARVEELERSIVLVDLKQHQPDTPRPRSAEPLPEERSKRHERAGEVISLPTLSQRSRPPWASLWRAGERGWELVASEGEDLPDPGRLLRHFDYNPRIYDSRCSEDRQIMPEGALLALGITIGNGDPGLLIFGGDDPQEGAGLDMRIDNAKQAGKRLVGKAQSASS